MQINIENVLTQKGKTLYWLSENTGITYAAIYNLSKNKTNAIKFDVLEKICIALECTPNDVLVIEKPLLSK
jgi:putative transcriptional regulator